MDFLIEVTGNIDSWMYTYLLVVLLVFAAVYFTIRTKFVQFRYIGDMFRQLTEKKHVEGEKSISSFQALMVSTASRVGTGNIAGVAVAVGAGGPGAIFWMWLMAILGAASAFVESTLAQIWKVRGKDGEFRGGPAYYIQQALHSRGFGILFAILLILCYAYGFNGLQAFNMTSAVSAYVPEDATGAFAIAIGIVLAVLTGFVIVGSSSRISTIASILVPIMAGVYLLLGLIITIVNIGDIPAMFVYINTMAFDFSWLQTVTDPQSFFGGLAGSMTMLGIKRGLYSNEAGIGSAPNAAATASVSHPVKQGLVQSLSVYIDTIFICSITAFILMIYYVNAGGLPIDPETGETLTGMPLVQAAIYNGLSVLNVGGIDMGAIGMAMITFAIVAFAFSSLIGNYFYAEGNILFITHSKSIMMAFRFTCLAAIFVGCIVPFDLAWNLADIFMGFMAIENLIVILLLGKWAFKALDDYGAQKKRGLDPVFVAASIPGMPETQCWHLGKDDLQDLGRGREPLIEYLKEASGLEDSVFAAPDMSALHSDSATTRSAKEAVEGADEAVAAAEKAAAAAQKAAAAAAAAAEAASHAADAATEIDENEQEETEKESE